MIDTIIQTILKNAESCGKITIVKLQQTEFMFTTEGLDTFFPPDPIKKSQYIKTGHKVVYNIVIENHERILFTAMITNLSHSDERLRTKIFTANRDGIPRGEFSKTQIIWPLDITYGKGFLAELKLALDYFLEIAIPAYEKKLLGKRSVISCVTAKGSSAALLTGKVSFDVPDCRDGEPDPIPVLYVTLHRDDIDPADFYSRCIMYNTYLRDSSAGDFTGRGWNEANPYSAREYYKGVPYNVYFLTRDAMCSAGYKPYKITVEHMPSVTNYLYPCYAYDNKPNPAISDVKIDGDIKGGFTYKDEDIILDGGYDLYQQDAELIDIEKRYRKFVYDNYHAVPDDVAQEIDRLMHLKDAQKRLNVKKWNGTREHLKEIIEDVKNYFRKGFHYSYDCIIPDWENVVVYFLKGKTDYKGVCRHFASAATLIFRHLGIAARYVGGYHCRSEHDVRVEVTAKDAHAWVEVYFDDLGWVIVDPTPPLLRDTPKQ